MLILCLNFRVLACFWGVLRWQWHNCYHQLSSASIPEVSIILVAITWAHHSELSNHPHNKLCPSITQSTKTFQTWCLLWVCQFSRSLGWYMSWRDIIDVVKSDLHSPKHSYSGRCSKKWPALTKAQLFCAWCRYCCCCKLYCGPVYFSRSLGIKVEAGSVLVSEIKEKSHHNTITREQLRSILLKHIPSLAETWPSHNDVLRAFKVFDTEGVGFIKVTMLKRFLVQSQLAVDESVCKLQISIKWSLNEGMLWKP